MEENSKAVDTNETLTKVAIAAQNLMEAATDMVNRQQIVVDDKMNGLVKKNEPTEENNSESQRSEDDNSFYAEGIPFLVELKFTKWSKETEGKLMKIFMYDEEIMPGLKIHKLYKAALHSDSLYLDKISEKLDSIKADVEGYQADLTKTMRNLVKFKR